MDVGDPFLTLTALTWAAPDLVCLSPPEKVGGSLPEPRKNAELKPEGEDSRKRGTLLHSTSTQTHTISLMGAGRNGHSAGAIASHEVIRIQVFQDIFINPH